jgi:hypothetical protein
VLQNSPKASLVALLTAMSAKLTQLGPVKASSPDNPLKCNEAAALASGAAVARSELPPSTNLFSNTMKSPWTAVQ